MSTTQNDLVVHKLELRLENFTGEAAGHLPLVDCEFCGGRPGGGADFPLVEAAGFTDVLWKVDIKNLKPRTTTWECFEQINDRARKLTGDPDLQLVPGCALGHIKIEPIGRWPTVLLDIDYASPGGLLFSRELVDALAKKGFNLAFQPIELKEIRLGKTRQLQFCVMQPCVYKLLHEETFIRNPGIAQCDRCGAINIVKPYPTPLPKSPSHLFLRGEFRDKVAPLFRVTGYEGCCFVSDALKEALAALRPSGLKLQSFGIWK